MNATRKKRMADKIVDAFGGVQGQDDRGAGPDLQAEHRRHARRPELVIVPALQAEGATVRAYDPEGMNEAEKAAAERRMWRRRLRSAERR